MPRPTALDWDTLDAALVRALDLHADERDAFLASLDGKTRDALAPLLRDALADDPLLDHSEEVLAPLRREPPLPDRSLDGARVGAYRLDTLVGEGGMGRVYRAHRADGAFEQTVAVKVVRTSLALAGADVAPRLRRERALLAALDHPGIARLVDGGETDDGVPYLVTEFVDGAPITDWAAARGLSVEARVRLIVDVARAVDHAHRRFVIHRDLKPSNVLVTERDGSDGQPSARPVVLDFGIATLLDAAEGDGSASFPLTRTGLRLLTPAYAAPELFEPGVAVTTAADVYGLGALLYELLAGRRPHDDAFAGGPPTTEPAWPSRLVATRADDPMRARDATPRRLQGDLDTICLRALHPDPARRYASAAALADDLTRHLEGRPVEARRDSLAYVAGRFARRHRPSVAAAAFALVALVGGLSVALVSLTAEREARAEAEAAAEQAAEAAELLGSLFEAADPTRGAGRPVTAREALDAGVARVAGVESPALRGYLLGVLGQTYVRIGEVALADTLLASALGVLDGLDGTAPSTVAALRVSRSATRAALGDLDGALALCRRARAETRALGDAPITLRALHGLARSYRDVGQHAKALRAARAAVAMARRLGDDEALIRALVVSGEVLGVGEGTVRALDPLAEARSLSERRYGLGDARTIDVQVSQGWVLGLVGRNAEAEAALDAALDAHRRRFGARTLAAGYLLSYTGDAQRHQGKDRQAEASLDSALAISRAFLPADHADLGAWQAARASVRNRLGRHAAAEADARTALRIARAHRDRLGASLALAQLALALRGQGRHAEARPVARRALAGLANAAPPQPVVAAEVAAAQAALRR